MFTYLWRDQLHVCFQESTSLDFFYMRLMKEVFVSAVVTLIFTLLMLWPVGWFSQDLCTLKKAMVMLPWYRIYLFWRGLLVVGTDSVVDCFRSTSCVSGNHMWASLLRQITDCYFVTVTEATKQMYRLKRYSYRDIQNCNCYIVTVTEAKIIAIAS